MSGRFVLTPALKRWITSWRLKRNLSARVLADVAAPLLINEAAFEMMLNRAVTRPGRTGFALPVAFARRAMGPLLHLTVPARALKTVLSFRIFSNGHYVSPVRHFIGDGDFNPVSFQFTAHHLYGELAELAACGGDFRKTGAYAAFLSRMDSGCPVRRNDVDLRTTALVDAYFERYLRLLASIKTHGLLRIAETRPWNRPQASDMVRVWSRELRETDIGVAVNADGGLFLLPEARHRAAYAVILDLPAVPVEVRLVHRRWAQGAIASVGPEATATAALSAALRNLQPTLLEERA